MALEKKQLECLNGRKKIHLNPSKCYMKPLNLCSFNKETALMLSTIAGLLDNTEYMFV